MSTARAYERTRSSRTPSTWQSVWRRLGGSTLLSTSSGTSQGRHHRPTGPSSLLRWTSSHGWSLQRTVSHRRPAARVRAPRWAIHALGLKFGIHVMRGVPRQAVHAGTPILGTTVSARDIAQTNSICPWNTDMYGVNPSTAGAQEYYDSLFALYACWGVDFVKVDDILLPYAAGEIECIRRAIDKAGRDMVLSLSCGPTGLQHADHLRQNADMWRITGDFWDRWEDLYSMFEPCRAWAAFSGNGHWPDADMLPLGRIALRSREHGCGDRWTRFTRAEQQTMMSLWSIVGSPLMLGSFLPDLDDWTLGLLTNSDVLAMHRLAQPAPGLSPGGPGDMGRGRP